MNVHLKHAILQTITVKPGDWACCAYSCSGCEKRSYSEFMAIARLRNKVHEIHCSAVRCLLVNRIQNYEQNAQRTGIGLHEYLKFLDVRNYSCRQQRAAQKYCQANGINWDSIGSHYLDGLAQANI